MSAYASITLSNGMRDVLANLFSKRMFTAVHVSDKSTNLTSSSCLTICYRNQCFAFWGKVPLFFYTLHLEIRYNNSLSLNDVA